VASPELLGVESAAEPLSIILLLEASEVVLVLENRKADKVVLKIGYQILTTNRCCHPTVTSPSWPSLSLAFCV
jgi:hypothetical protein